MLKPITFTFDLEDHRPSDSAWPARYPELTLAMLDWMDGHAITATVFVVGSVAEAHPELVRTVAERGHEIGLHNWDHVQVTTQDAASFREGIRRGKHLLEDITGAPVAGFRAPTGSLVPASTWAIDVIRDEGYTYSSSVCPGRNPINSFPGAPEGPFTFTNGLAEFPMPVAAIGPVHIPYLSGTYMRVVPSVVQRGVQRLASDLDGPVSYCHPYDFDTDEPFWWVSDVGWLSPLLWMGRKRFRTRLDRLVAGGTGPPLGELLALARSGPVFDPHTATVCDTRPSHA